MKTFTDFARFGNPTPQQVLGIHFDRARNGELKYLNLNTTYNSSILLNFRQTESAFWTQVLSMKVSVTTQLVHTIYSISVFANSDRCVSTNLSTIYGILVGTKGTVTDSLLEYVRCLSVSNGSSSNLLYAVAQC